MTLQAFRPLQVVYLEYQPRIELRSTDYLVLLSVSAGPFSAKPTQIHK